MLLSWPLSFASPLRSENQDVRQLHSTHHAFAALRKDGRVIAWGAPDAGGDCSAVAEELKDVHMWLGRGGDGLESALNRPETRESSLKSTLRCLEMHEISLKMPFGCLKRA